MPVNLPNARQSGFPPARVEGRTFQFSFPLPGIQHKSKPDKDVPTRKPNGKTKAPLKGQQPAKAGQSSENETYGVSSK